MQFRALACVTLALVASSVAGLNCAGRFSSEYDLWCQSSCNNQPPFCPDAFCQCAGAAAPLECSAVGPFAGLDDAWCNLNCNHEPPFCPEEHCTCGPVASPAPVAAIQPHENSCCQEDDQVLFYANETSIYKLVQGFEPVVCYSFPIGEPSGMVVDDEGNLYVADPVAGTVYRMSVNCNESSVVVLSSWIRDGVIDRPTAIAIVPGQGLLVSGTVGIYSLTFRDDGSVFNVVRLPNIIFRVRDIEIVGQRAYFVHRDGEVLIVDLATNQIVTYIAIHQHNIPDYGGITINECGFFFTATDSNQVFYCPDINDGSVCERYCVIDRTIDGTTCININQPTGISSGCCCDIYVSNSANGCLVHYPNNGILPFQSIGPQVGEVVSCGLTRHQGSVFYNPPRPAGSLCTDVCVPTPPPTPSTSPSSSRTVTPSVSATSSTSISATSSISQSSTSSTSRSSTSSISQSSTSSISRSSTSSISQSSTSSISQSSTSSTSRSSTSSISVSSTSSISQSSTSSISQSSTSSISQSSTSSISQSSTSSISISATSSISVSATRSPSPSPSATSSISQSSTSSISQSSTSSISQSSTSSISQSSTSSISQSSTSSISQSSTSSISQSSTSSISQSSTSSISQSSTSSISQSSTSSISQSSTSSISQSSTSSISVSRTVSPTPSPTRRLGRLVPGVNLQGSGGFTQAGLLTGTATISFFLCDVGQPLFDCIPNLDNSNNFRIPVNKLEVLSREDETFRTTSIAVFIQAVSRPGATSTGFQPSCLFHATPIYHNGTAQVACETSCFFNTEIGQPRLSTSCSAQTTIPTEEARDRTRAGMNIAAANLGLTGFDARANNAVPSTLFQSASTDICTNDVIAEFSVSLLQITTGQAVDVTILSQPRFDITDRCDASKTRAQRLCFNTTPYINTLFNGIQVGDDRGYVCISEFLVDEFVNSVGGELRPNNFRASDSVLKILVGDIIDTSFSVSSRSSGCPSSIPTTLCAASNRRLCHQNECI